MRQVKQCWRHILSITRHNKNISSSELRSNVATLMKISGADYDRLFDILSREVEEYGKIPNSPDMTLIMGEDATLLYWYQCDKCGCLVCEDHSDDDCLYYDIICPLCCNIPEKSFPFKFIKRGTIQWILRMSMMPKRDEKINEYVSGSTDYKYSITYIMRVKLYLLTKVFPLILLFRNIRKRCAWSNDKKCLSKIGRL